MAVCRILLAVLITLAVAVAPVSGSLMAGHAMADPANARAVKAGQAGVHDCHGRAPASSPDKETARGPGADIDMDAECRGDGSRCCKLTGTLPFQPSPFIVITAADRGAEPQEPTAWSLKPRPPPPRS
jgi:hypothetical protein